MTQSIAVRFDDREVSAVIAALRYFQTLGAMRVSSATALDIVDIATNGDQYEYPSDEYIDALCEKLNFAGRGFVMTDTFVPIAQLRKANRRLKMFEDAHDAFLFRGANPLEDKEATEARYLAARSRIINMLTREIPL